MAVSSGCWDRRPTLQAAGGAATPPLNVGIGRPGHRSSTSPDCTATGMVTVSLTAAMWPVAKIEHAAPVWWRALAQIARAAWSEATGAAVVPGATSDPAGSTWTAPPSDESACARAKQKIISIDYFGHYTNRLLAGATIGIGRDCGNKESYIAEDASRSGKAARCDGERRAEGRGRASNVRS